MKLTDQGGGNFEQAPVGSHVARCIKMVDIGTQKNDYQGQVNFKRQIIISWELPNELMTTEGHEGKPFVVSKFYTASLNEKATLRKDLANWRGRDFTEQELLGFDSHNLLDKGCMLSVIHNDKQKAKVSGVMALPRGMTLPARVNDLVYFSLEPDEFDQKMFDSMTDGLKKMIEISPEYQQLKNGKPLQDLQSDGGIGGMDDDIPF